jgi:hydroxypyruvate isomerase
MKFDVCVETVFPELPIGERIAKIAQCGYKHIEFWFQDWPAADAIKQACAEYGVTVNNVVVNGPDGSTGGAPVCADDYNKYLERLEEVIAFTAAIGCKKGITCTGNLQPGLTRAQMRANLEKAMGDAAKIAEKHGFTLLLECLNTHVDHAGYYLDSSGEGAEIVRAINSPNFRLLYDVYHMQIMEGNLISNIEKHLDVIGHFHSAGVPGRHELFGNEINYPEIVKRIEAKGYTGCFGLEYFPAIACHETSLRENLAYLTGQASAV